MASPPGDEDGFTVMAAARSEAPAEWPLLGERLLPARLLAELPGHELLQVLRDLLRGGGHHLRQDDLLRDRQELAHQRLDDLLNRELLTREQLLTGELGLHVGLLRGPPVLLGEAAHELLRCTPGLREPAVLLRLALVLLDAERYLGQPQQYGGFPQSWGGPRQ